jgi:hypothetical protein
VSIIQDFIAGYDQELMESPPICEVDLKTGTIRWPGCEDLETMIGAAENRLALVISQLSAPSGLTNRQRRGLNRGRNNLSLWLRHAARGNPDLARYWRKKKATSKGVRWLARKLDRATNLPATVVGTQNAAAN